MNTVEIGNYIKEKREFKGWSQEELAELVNVSSKTISNWENGKTNSIKIEHLEKLADVFNVSFLEVYNSKDMPQLDDDTKNSLSLLIKRQEERSFLALELSVAAYAVSIVAIAFALGALLPLDTPSTVCLYLLAGFGVWFGIFGVRIVRRKAKEAKQTSPISEHNKK